MNICAFCGSNPSVGIVRHGYHFCNQNCKNEFDKIIFDRISKGKKEQTKKATTYRISETGDKPDKKIITCRRCGTENDSTLKKCSECGDYLYQYKNCDNSLYNLSQKNQFIIFLLSGIFPTFCYIYTSRWADLLVYVFAVPVVSVIAALMVFNLGSFSSSDDRTGFSFMVGLLILFFLGYLWSWVDNATAVSNARKKISGA